jgi:hypothetical protein
LILFRVNHMYHRAGELTQDEVEKLVAIIQSPKQFKIPTCSI